MTSPFFELRNITKCFSKVIANRGVNLSVEKGEVLALLGENGAGKSTLMKILYGLYRADEGQILVNGIVRRINSPKEAMALGISMIQQHFSLVPAHAVTENIILGNVRGRIEYSKYENEIDTIANKYNFNINLKAKIRDLSVGEQQKAEILKALCLKTSLLIMDEPTAVLTPQEIEKLMQFVHEFASQGNSVIFITHKLKEVMEVADRIVVMRNGVKCGDIKKNETDEKQLTRMMIDRDINIEADSVRRTVPSNKQVLKLENITVCGKGIPLLDKVDFSVHGGEILGIAGVSGNGQMELCEVICGALKAESGTIFLDGKDVTALSILDRINMGVGYVVSNRHKEGLVMDMSIAEKMMLKKSFDKQWQSKGFLNRKKINAYATKAIEDYRIKAPGPEAAAKGLSGGNQQKVVVAREVGCGERVIVFDQPTRGLDLGAIENVHNMILAQREMGKGILLVSTELNEIFALSDRVAVIYKGRIMGIFRKSELSTEKTGLLMAGYATEGDMR
jgi:simple sugar transport system ATP-binding protein